MVERPTYPHALGALRRRGARLVPVGVNEGWDIELIAGAMRQAAVRMAYTIPDFQNPTGYLMGADDRAALVDAARRADAFLVTDETFAELAHDPDAPRRRRSPPTTPAGGSSRSGRRPSCCGAGCASAGSARPRRWPAAWWWPASRSTWPARCSTS